MYQPTAARSGSQRRSAPALAVSFAFAALTVGLVAVASVAAAAPAAVAAFGAGAATAAVVTVVHSVTGRPNVDVLAERRPVRQ